VKDAISGEQTVAVDPATAIDLPIIRVTLLEDRAHVVRSGSIQLAGSEARLRIERIAPVAVDKTLSVAVASDGEGRGAVRVVDARIRRRAEIRLRDGGGEPGERVALRAQLAGELDQLSDRIERRRAEHDVMVRQAEAFDQAAALSLAELAEDVSWGAPIGAEWSARLDRDAAEERELAARLVQDARELDELEAARGRLETRIAVLARPDAEERADLEIELAGPAGAACQLRVDYVVPGALWRPWHTAQLGSAEEDQTAELELVTDGCIWQNTGEDWRDVEILLSTERASLGARPPRLASDVLYAVRKGELEIEMREQEIDTAGLGGGSARLAAELPGIDDGGEAVTLHASERATIPSDGRPHRVRLGRFTTEAKTELCAYPELTPAVLFKSTQDNRGSMPLLAGPVDLVRSSGLVGRTSILYVAPGERFELGWGPEADLRLSRDSELIEEKTHLIGTRVTRQTRVRVALSNLGASHRRITVTERVPVSEIDRVKIEVDPTRVSDRAHPDENGFVRWTVELGPYGQKRLELNYRLHQPS
jgi:uncharacterized protein (TIGR02231 family)